MATFEPRLRWFSQLTTKWILIRLALQNLGRRKARTLLLIIAVAVASGAIFATTTILWGIQNSMSVGFSRLGADLLVVPQGTLVNITSALLTAEPTELTLDANLVSQIAHIQGVKRVAPQQIYRTNNSGYHQRGHDNSTLDLIGFDPQQDFTVMPWLAQKLDRPLQTGDVIVGGQRDAKDRLRDRKLNEEIYLYGKRLIVYGQLSRTGVGTHERGLFVTFDTLKMLAQASQAYGAAPLPFSSGQYSGLLVELKPDATSRQVRFAILANAPQTKVVVGGSILTTVRQGLTALLSGILLLMLMMLLGTALMVSVIFSAIITERRHELGLLAAIGAKRSQMLRLILLESSLATGLGGFCGVGLGIMLMRLYQRSLIYHLDTLGIPFIWPSPQWIVELAASCVFLSALVGIFGAMYPAWRASREDPYELIRAEG